MMFKRILAPFLLQRLAQRPVVALLGSRQVGKTTLAKQLINQISHPSIYIDLESPADRNKLLDAESYLLQRSDQLIIIDEVQRMPELFPILRSVIDRDRRNGRFLLLGSASPTLITTSSETLAGRIDYLELSPLTYSEIATEGDWQTLWLRGGFPESFLAIDSQTSFLNRTSFLRTYIERELPLLGFSDNQRRIADLLVRMLAHVHGNLINYADLSRSIGVNQQRIKDIIAYFEQSYLVRLLPPFYTNTGKRLIKTPKIYFQDSGLFHTLAGIETKEELEGFDRKGASWEGFIIQQVIALLLPTITPYFYRTQDGAELDLLLVKGNQPVLALEVKYSNTPTLQKGTTIALSDLGDIPCLIVTPSVEEDYNIRPNQLVTSMTRLLQHPAIKSYLLPMQGGL